MERRSFLKYASATVAALSLPPIVGNASASTKLDALYRTPALTDHVRHGLFQLSEVKLPLLPKWLRFYQGHRLFSNGTEPSDGDLQTFSLSIYNRPLTVGFDRENAFLISEDEVLELNESKAAGQSMVYRGQHDNRELSDVESVVFVLRGKCTINGQASEIPFLNAAAGGRQHMVLVMSPN